MDTYATAAAMLGADVPSGAAADSFNILPYLAGEKLDRPAA